MLISGSLSSHSFQFASGESDGEEDVCVCACADPLNAMQSAQRTGNPAALRPFISLYLHVTYRAKFLSAFVPEVRMRLRFLAPVLWFSAGVALAQAPAARPQTPPRDGQAQGQQTGTATI